MRVGIDISPLKTGNFLQHRVRGTGFYIRNLKYSLEKFCKENSYIYFSRGDAIPSDLNLIHIPYFEPFFVTLPSSKKTKRIVTVHDLTPFVFPDQFPSGVKGKIKWSIQKKRLLRSDAIITDSESSKKDIEKFVGTSTPVYVIYLAADEFKKILVTELDKKTVLEKYNLPHKFALYVGDATWNKNLPRLIRSLEDTNIPLVMVGKTLKDQTYDKNNQWNKDIAYVQEAAQKNKNITLTGFVPNDDLLLLYNLATLFVMPSLYEGFGLPLLEAMSCGVPCITSKKGSLGEVGGEAPFYIDPYSESNMREGIEKVWVKADLRKKMQKKGLEQVKKFSWEKTASQTAEVYHIVSGV